MEKLNVNEVYQYLQNQYEVLNEMSYRRKDYKSKIEDISSQIIENWCLIRYCKIANRTEYKKYWTDELRGHLLSVSRYKLRKNDSFNSRMKVVDEIWDEIELDRNADAVNKTINNKFKKENIPTNTMEYAQVLTDCINEHKDIETVIVCCDINQIDQYLKTL